MTKYLVFILASIFLLETAVTSASAPSPAGGGRKATVSKLGLGKAPSLSAVIRERSETKRRMSISKQESAAINLRKDNTDRLNQLQRIAAILVKNPVLGGPGDPRYDAFSDALTNAVKSCGESGGEASDVTDYRSTEGFSKAIRSAELVGVKYQVDKLFK